jgi:hypothetical protein
LKPELGIIFASAFKRIQNPVYDVNTVRRMTERWTFRPMMAQKQKKVGEEWEKF